MFKQDEAPSSSTVAIRGMHFAMNSFADAACFTSRNNVAGGIHPVIVARDQSLNDLAVAVARRFDRL
jgi:hypothetical protein